MFESPIEFSAFIEKGAEQNDMGLLEFLTEYVVQNSIEEEVIPPMLTSALKAKIEKEAQKEYFMPKKTYQELDL